SATTTAPVVPEMKYGDINADNVVDLTDLTYLSLYLLNDKTFDDAQLERADVLYDSSVDIADLAYLKQYISKDDVVLGKH
ncbi:MAG: dockerin type I repeat-containing protein, partial [Oscillospiraceae bacterium]|nr:dockerin type I repeat-containing protein [Oscillospiraceae bacterium]